MHWDYDYDYVAASWLAPMWCDCMELDNLVWESGKPVLGRAIVLKQTDGVASLPIWWSLPQDADNPPILHMLVTTVQHVEHRQAGVEPESASAEHARGQSAHYAQHDWSNFPFHLWKEAAIIHCVSGWHCCSVSISSSWPLHVPPPPPWLAPHLSNRDWLHVILFFNTTSLKRVHPSKHWFSCFATRASSAAGVVFWFKEQNRV